MCVLFLALPILFILLHFTDLILHGDRLSVLNNEPPRPYEYSKLKVPELLIASLEFHLNDYSN